MSEDIRKYQTIKRPISEKSTARDMILHAFIGGENGAAISFVIGSEYCELSSKQLLDMISVIARRLNHEEGFTATGYTDMITVTAEGTKLIEFENQEP